MNMFQIIADRFAEGVLQVDPSTWPAMWVVYAAFIGIGGFLTFAFVALFAGPLSFVERRIAGRIMSRVGPNRVGPNGILQWLADGIKCWLKEDLIPATADRPLFRAAPYLVFTGMFGAFVVLPFGAHVVAADLNVGILYIFAITGFVVVGLLMAGWGSNSKWALFGGVRSAAQLVSYEIPSALALLSVVLASGTMSLQGIIEQQGGFPWEWFIFRNPFLFVGFFLYFISALAEGNRTPFDLPEAESELIAGYNIEYSGMRFLFFLFAEWANIWIMAAVSTVCFLGGWQIPGVSPERIAESQGLVYAGWQLLSFVILVLKASVLVFLVVQLRWTLPRLRIDQLMATCWKYLVPLSLAVIFGVMVLLVVVKEKSIADYVLRAVMLTAGVAVFLLYVGKIRATYMADRDVYRKLEGKEQWYPPYRLP